MNQGINVKLPLVYDSSFGPYKLNTKVSEAINQNLYVLFKTAPGERIMNTDYGIGIGKFLFENMTPFVIEQLEDRIRSQIAKYIKGLVIEKLDIYESPNQQNTIQVSLAYYIPSLNAKNQFFVNSRG